jgi:acyl-CoA dehydrogenase
VLYNVIDRAIQVHGSLGYSCDLPLESMYRAARAARIYDGPDEVHRQTVARRVLKGYVADRGADRAHPDPAGRGAAAFADLLDDDRAGRALDRAGGFDRGEAVQKEV